MSSPQRKKPDDGRGASSAANAGNARGNRQAPADDDESPGVPGFRTWRGIYVFVALAFVAMVVALTLFSHIYA